MSVHEPNGLKIFRRNGVFVLTGCLDEFADLEPLVKATDPIVIDLGGVERINSIGLQSLLKVIISWGKVRITYVNCSIEFTEFLNLIPPLLGVNGQVGRVESLVVPFTCRNCGHQENFNCPFAAFEPFVHHNGACPTKHCKQCAHEMTLAAPEYFQFSRR